MFSKALIKATTYAGVAFGVLYALSIFVMLKEGDNAWEFFDIANMVGSIGISIVEIVILLCLGKALSAKGIEKPGKGVIITAMVVSVISAVCTLTADDVIELFASLIGIILYIVIGSQLRKNKITSKIGWGFTLYPVCAVISLVVMIYLEFNQVSSTFILKYSAFLSVAGWFILLEAFENFMLSNPDAGLKKKRKIQRLKTKVSEE